MRRQLATQATASFLCLGGPIMPNLLATGRLGRLSVAAAGALMALAVTAGDVLAAAEAAHGGEHGEHKGGLPQLDPHTFPTQIFWLAITFAILYFLMSSKALPAVGKVLEQRQARIAKDLATAQSAKAEAEALLAKVEGVIAENRQAAHATIAEAVGAAEAAAAARNAAVGSAIADKLRQADARILAAKNDAVANVRSAAAELARDVTQKLAGVNPAAGVAEAAVAAALEETRS